MLIAQVQLAQGTPDTSRTQSQTQTRSAGAADNEASAFARKLDEALSEQNGASENRRGAERAEHAETERSERAGHAKKRSGKRSEKQAAAGPEAASEAKKQGKTAKPGKANEKEAVALKTGGKAIDKDGVAKSDVLFSKQVSPEHAEKLAVKPRRGETRGELEEADSLGPRERQDGVESPRVMARGGPAAGGDAAGDSAGDAAEAQGAAISAAQGLERGETTVRTVSNPEGANGDVESPQRTERPASDERSAVLEVRDYRSRRGAADRTSGRAAPENIDATNKDVAIERTAEADRDGEGPQIRLVRNWTNGSEGNEPAARTARGSAFTAYVRDTVNTQLVKQSGIILRNNNRGEIRLVLKPEHLGRVRVRIQLDDNRLSGRIFVDSSFVKESFEQNLTSLYRSLRDSGFETSEFEVLVDGGEQKDAADGSPDDTPRGPGDGYIEAAVKTIQQLDDAVPILEGPGLSDHVNLVV